MNSQKTKILYGITKGNWGGAQKYVYDLATALPRERYEVTVLIGKDGLLAERLGQAGIRTIILGNLFREIKPAKDFFALLKLIKIFRQERPDIVHLNSSKMGLLGALAGRLTGIKKIIFTGHGWAFNEDRSQLQKKAIYFLHLITIALAHKTIAVSAETKNQIRKNNPFRHKIVIVKNGLGKIDFLDRETARNRLAEKLPSDLDSANGLWLGTISELHKNKGLKYLIEALHLLEAESDDPALLPILIIIGDGERKEKLEQRIKRYNLENLVFLVGRINEAEKYLKAFDIFTLTSITEALPYAILEAGQAGRPIIASKVGGIPEIVDDMENGILVPPREPEEIKEAIAFLLKNPEKMSVFGQKIREKVLTEFSKEKMVKETLEIYGQI